MFTEEGREKIEAWNESDDDVSCIAVQQQRPGPACTTQEVKKTKKTAIDRLGRSIGLVPNWKRTRRRRK